MKRNKTALLTLLVLLLTAFYARPDDDALLPRDRGASYIAFSTKECPQCKRSAS